MTQIAQRQNSTAPDPEYVERFGLKALPKLGCGNVDCDNGLHCFRYYEQQKRVHPIGSCNACGERLVNWQRAHHCDVVEIDAKFNDMKHEWIRHYYWHVNIDAEALRLAAFRGRRKTLERLEQRLRKDVTEKRLFDGQGVAWKGDIVCYARHATATCCRRCIAYWHGIPTDHVLTESEIRYLFALSERYIRERVPDLAEDPDPTRRKRATGRRQATKGRKWRP